MEAAAVPVENEVKGRILVVEDEPIVSIAIEESLIKMGYIPCAIVDNGPEAIKRAGELNPDCVLMDIQLIGEMDGIEAAERIVALYDIPVVYLTAQTDNKTLLRAMNTLPYGYLVKPFKKEQLYSTIERAVHKHRVLGRIQPKKARISAAIDLIPDAVITIDENWEVDMINPRAERMIGWTNDEANGRDVFELLGIEGMDADAMKSAVGSESGSKPFAFTWPGEYTITTRFGAPLNVEVMIRELKGGKAQEGEVFLVIRKKEETGADEEIIHSNTRNELKNLIELIPEPAYVIDKEMKLVGYNSAFSELAHMLGLTKLRLKKSIHSDNTMNNFGYRHEYEDAIRKDQKQTGNIGFSAKKTFYVGSVYRYPIKLDDGIVVLSIIWDFGPQKQKKEFERYPAGEEVEDIATKILELDEEYRSISSCLNAIEDLSKSILEKVVYNKDAHPGFGELEELAWKEISTINKMRTRIAEMRSKGHSIYGVWLLKER